jgi:hypothetical protein
MSVKVDIATRMQQSGLPYELTQGLGTINPLAVASMFPAPVLGSTDLVLAYCQVEGRGGRIFYGYFEGKNDAMQAATSARKRKSCKSVHIIRTVESL